MKELCPTEALHEECGVFGIYDSTGKTNMVSAVYSALYALQHRGQESCGIALNVDGVLTGYRDLGLVSEVFTRACWLTCHRMPRWPPAMCAMPPAASAPAPTPSPWFCTTARALWLSATTAT